MNSVAHTVPGKKKLAPAQRDSTMGFGRSLLYNLVGLFVLCLTLPVALLFATTSVPLLFAFGLWVSDAVLLYALPRVPHTLSKLGGVSAGIILLSIVALVASQSFASTPAFTDAEGTLLPGSIATLEQVSLNGTPQWICIRGRNVNKPVLLNLGTGVPGSGGVAARPTLGDLEREFVVISWDMPGSGKSYGAVPIQALNRERFVQDGYALTKLLRNRFHQDKIFLYATGWTSLLGIQLIREHPELFYAYVGNGQLVNSAANDRKRYERALGFASHVEDVGAMERFTRNGVPPYFGEKLVQKYWELSDFIDAYMGAPSYVWQVATMPLFLPEYGLLDKVNHFRGIYETFKTVYPQLQNIDLTMQAKQFDVPIYLIAGRQDIYVDPWAIEDYFDMIQAPRKALIWVESTEQGLSRESTCQVADVFTEQVLPETECEQSRHSFE